MTSLYPLTGIFLVKLEELVAKQFHNNSL